MLSDLPSVRGGERSARDDAEQIGERRAREVADSYGMDNVDVAIRFHPTFEPGNWVTADASVDVDLMHVLLGRRIYGSHLGPAVITISSHQWERIDLYRSRRP